MADLASTELEEGRARFEHFRREGQDAREFRFATCHPSQPTGFCPCDGPWLRTLWFYARAAAVVTVLRLPFNRPKIALLRWSGAKVGQNVFISADVWIDPTFPELLTIEDDVLIGVGAKIGLHEFGIDEFRAGRVILRQHCVIGGFAMIRCGVEIGRGAVVSAGAAVGRDVPAGTLALGNPARIHPLRRRPGHGEPA